MTVYRFQEITFTVRKAGPCPRCGQRARRQATFSQTVNPFNRLPDGTIKSSAVIWEELRAEGAAWKAEPVWHALCERWVS